MTTLLSGKGESHHSGLSQGQIDTNVDFESSQGKLSLQMGNETNPNPVHSDHELAELFDENAIAKIWRVAATINKNHLPERYPHTVPQTGPNAGQYELREATFWTCGFFPGSVYTLLERCVKYPQRFPISEHIRPNFHKSLLELCRRWDGPIRTMSSRTDTHDMGFIVQPALRKDWELNGNTDSLRSIITAAHSLASRFDDRVKAIRSWNQAVNKRYSIVDQKTNFLVIIDSMCNLDLLCYAAYHTGNKDLIDMATSHAHIVRQNVVRDDFSTYHLVNFCPETGLVKQKMTNQGYSDSSTWSRGQAWAILGFTQMYSWTKDPEFLKTAVGVSKYFLKRLDESQHEFPYVPLWDFDAPQADGEPPLRDTSAGMIAANGMILLHQLLSSRKLPRTESRIFFLEAALKITRQTISLSLSDSKAAFSRAGSGEEIEVVDDGKDRFDGILRIATANRNQDALMPYWDHGVVYADYYFLEFGNQLLRMGIL